MQPKKTKLHESLKAIHNIHKGSRGGRKSISLKKETTHNLKAGLKHHSRKSNVGKKKI
jgi:hypothetical protein